jgi:hypothetical protein
VERFWPLLAKQVPGLRFRRLRAELFTDAEKSRLDSLMDTFSATLESDSDEEWRPKWRIPMSDVGPLLAADVITRVGRCAHLFHEPGSVVRE